MPSRISVMFTASRVAPSVRTTSRSRSWVIGRAGRTPCCSKAIAAASTAPIQIGRDRSPWASLSHRDRQVPLPLRLLEQQDRLVARQLDTDADDSKLLHGTAPSAAARG